MGDRETRALASSRNERHSKIRTHAIELNRGGNSSIAGFNPHYASRIFHPLFSLKRKLDVYVELGSCCQRLCQRQQCAIGTYITQCSSLNKGASTAAGYFNSNLPIYLKPLRSSAFDQRASSVLQTDCVIEDLLHCCFTASFDKLKLKIDVFVLDERIN